MGLTGVLITGGPIGGAHAAHLQGSAFALHVHALADVVPKVPLVDLGGLDGNLNGGPVVGITANVALVGNLNTGGASDTLTSHTEGSHATPIVKSNATVEKLVITPLLGLGPNVLEATLIHSECQADVGGNTASTTIASLTILGVTQTLPVNIPPNFGLSVGTLATLVLNEQTTTGGTITVNALHLRALAGLAEVVVSQSVCGPQLVSVEIPEVPRVLLLPLSALAVIGVTSVVRRRRAAWENLG